MNITRDQSLSQFLRDKVAARGLTRAAVAEACGLSERALYHYLSDKRVPNAATLKKLAALLGVNPAWLEDRARRRPAGRRWPSSRLDC